MLKLNSDWLGWATHRLGYSLSKLEERYNSLKASRKLENEPRLYTRWEVIDYMQKAITLSQMSGSAVKDEDLDNLIN